MWNHSVFIYLSTYLYIHLLLSSLAKNCTGAMDHYFRSDKQQRVSELEVQV